MTTTALTTVPKQSALAVMAARFHVEPNKLLDTLKATAFKGATNEEMMALVIIANEYGFNPFTREIYAFPAKGGGIQPVVSVDGWIRKMNDHPQFDGIEFIEEMDKNGKPLFTTAIIYRKDRTRPTKITEYFSECYRNTDNWNTRPRRMLRHKATIQGIRTTFGLSGIVDEDEVINAVEVSGKIDFDDLQEKVPSAAKALITGRPEPVVEVKAETKPEPAPDPAPESPPEVDDVPVDDPNPPAALEFPTDGEVITEGMIRDGQHVEVKIPSELRTVCSPPPEKKPVHSGQIPTDTKIAEADAVLKLYTDAGVTEAALIKWCIEGKYCAKGTKDVRQIAINNYPRLTMIRDNVAVIAKQLKGK